MVKIKYKIIITDNAQKSILSIYDYIASDSEKNAKNVVAKFYSLIKSALRFPYKHPIETLQMQQDINNRYIGVWSYKIHFEIDNNKDLIIIHHVSHSSQSPENIAKKLNK